MFEASLKSILSADSELTAMLSTFESEPAIFSSFAPADAEGFYVVFDIEEFSTENLAVNGFDITIDIYSRDSSGVTMRNIAERIKFICDRQMITGDNRYGNIRLFWESGREVENKDIKVRHYVIKISARADRKTWMAQL